MGEAVTITSGKGGVGKSSVCVNIDVTLAQKGYRVCLINADLGLKDLDVVLGLENRVVYDLKDVMKGRCILANAMIRDKRQDNLYLLPACKMIHIQYFHGEGLKIVVEELKNQFDHILLDTSTGIESSFIHSVACVSRTIIVTALNVTTLQNAGRIIGALMEKGIEHISFIVNRVSVHHMDWGISVSLEKAEQWLSIGFLDCVFDDESMIRSNNHGKPIILQRETRTYNCLDSIARRMLG